MALSFNQTLQWIGAGSGALGGAFWIYTFHYIAKLPAGDGTGFQWLAEFPLSLVLLSLSLPAICVSFSRRLSAVSAGLGLSGLVAFAIIWTQLLEEFARLR